MQMIAITADRFSAYLLRSIDGAFERLARHRAKSVHHPLKIEFHQDSASLSVRKFDAPAWSGPNGRGEEGRNCAQIALPAESQFQELN